MSTKLDRAFAALRQGAIADPHGVVPTTALLASALMMNLASVEGIRREGLTADRRQMLLSIQRHLHTAKDQFRRLLSLVESLEVDIAEMLTATEGKPHAG